MNEEEIIRKNLKKLANNIFSKLNDVEKSYLLMVNNEKNKQINELQQELQRKENIINELKEYLILEIAEWQDVDNIPTRARVEEDKDILDKIEELENGNK